MNHGPIETVSVEQVAVFLKFLTVIGGDDDNGVLENVALIELRKKMAKLIVHVGDGSIVGGDQLLQLVRWKLLIRRPMILIQRVAGARKTVEVRARRHERFVDVEIINGDEEWTSVALDPVKSIA